MPPRKDAARPPFEYEFFGPVGTAFIMATLPITIVGLYAFCNEDVGCSVLPPAPLSAAIAAVEAHMPLITPLDAGLVLGWFMLHVVLYVVLPGPVRQGITNPDGSKLSYTMNGLLELAVSLSLAVGLHLYGAFDITIIYHRFLNLAVTSIAFSIILSVYTYAVSFVPGTLRAVPGSSDNVIYDFFIGRALTPRLLGLDLKFFCEQRPGLSAWCLINIACLVEQYNTLGYVTNGMWVVVLLTVMYVVDTFVFEDAVLTTADIMTEGFGFMLVFGDLAWVPFTYTFQARFLVVQPDSLSLTAALAIAALGLAGFLVFRMSNLEKHHFRHKPDSWLAKRLQYINTESGSRLITSGWWGRARHINYFGDWVLSLAQCIAAGGVTSFLPYWFVIYFGILLVHRERRDEHKCRLKYGRDWDKYCSKVPYRIIPYIY